MGNVLLVLLETLGDGAKALNEVPVETGDPKKCCYQSPKPPSGATSIPTDNLESLPEKKHFICQLTTNVTT